MQSQNTKLFSRKVSHRTMRSKAGILLQETAAFAVRKCILQSQVFGINCHRRLIRNSTVQKQTETFLNGRHTTTNSSEIKTDPDFKTQFRKRNTLSLVRKAMRFENWPQDPFFMMAFGETARISALESKDWPHSLRGPRLIICG